ncbi:MAG: hypothetical protein WC498_04450 [Candidatus Saccharimonadales bacterium]
MTNLIILGALVLVPVILITVLRANASIAFMSLCVGSVLVTYTSSDVTSVASGFSSKGSLVTNQWVQLVLLTAPFILTLWFTRHGVKSSKLFFNFFPALSGGLLFALLVVPLFSASLQHSLEGQTAWHQLTNLQTAVVLAGALLSLVFLLSTHRTLRKAEAKRRNHR